MYNRISQLTVFLVLVSRLTTCQAQNTVINLDLPNDERVTAYLDETGFGLQVRVAGQLTKLTPQSYTLRTRQDGTWTEPETESGDYVIANLNSTQGQSIKIVSILKLNPSQGDKRYQAFRSRIDNALRKSPLKKKAKENFHKKLLMEAVEEMMDQNISAGANREGRAAGTNPPLPSRLGGIEGAKAMQSKLREQCNWQGVRDVFESTGFKVTKGDFKSSQKLAGEIYNVLMGIDGGRTLLNESQAKALKDGIRYSINVRFTPQLQGKADQLWRSAPHLRIRPKLVQGANLEGTLSRSNKKTVGWWRIEADRFDQLEVKAAQGDGSIFWRWVHTPDDKTRFLRVQLHSPQVRYRLSLTNKLSSEGSMITLFDGPPSRFPREFGVK